MKILVTAGATREPIDAVRFLSNVSTGATGAALAQEFAARGHAAVLLRGKGAVAAPAGVESETFGSAADLEARLHHRLAADDYGAVVMAAAVSDYRPAQAAAGKISSAAAGLSIQLVRNEKILPRLKSFGRHPPRVIGFKLTVGADPAARQAAVAAQFSAGGVDAVVHNDLHEIRSSAAHLFYLWKSAGGEPTQLAGTVSLAAALLDFLQAGPP